jgi:hypothetical protein
MGMPSVTSWLQPQNNKYKNPFGTEIALLRTSEGGMARMAVSWDTPGHEGEMGRVRGQRGSMTGMNYIGDQKNLPDLTVPGKPAQTLARYRVLVESTGALKVKADRIVDYNPDTGELSLEE